jgi:predicted dehydrogenase
MTNRPFKFNRRDFLVGTLAGTFAAAANHGVTSVSYGAVPAVPAKIKVGQIGVGHAHASKLSVYRRLPDYEVVGLCEPDETLRSAAIKQSAYAGLPLLSRDELLAVPGLQAVLVESHVRDSLEHAEACVAAGKHVHLDKPAGESWGHYQRVVAAAERQRLMVQMGYMYRYNPAMMLLRQFLAQGWLGDVFEVHTVMSKVVPPRDRLPLAEYPGGMMFELGCHIIDQVVSVLGKPAAVRAFPRQTVPGDKLVDNMLAVFEYPRATATIRATALEVDGGERRHLTVCGTRGTFHIQPLDSPRVRVTLDQPRGTFQRGYQDVTFPKYERYVGDAIDMARIIRGEKGSDFPYSHDLAVQESVLLASGLPLTGTAKP